MKLLNEYTTAGEPVTLITRADFRAARKSSWDLLETIRTELGLNQAGEQAAAEEQKEQAEREQDAGLTSEINTSGTMVNLADTIRSLVLVLCRHRYGFKGDGARDKAGRMIPGKFEPYTPEENEEAEKWADGPKQGKEWATTGRLATDKE